MDPATSLRYAQDDGESTSAYITFNQHATAARQSRATPPPTARCIRRQGEAGAKHQQQDRSLLRDWQRSFAQRLALPATPKPKNTKPLDLATPKPKSIPL